MFLNFLHQIYFNFLKWRILGFYLNCALFSAYKYSVTNLIPGHVASRHIRICLYGLKLIPICVLHKVHSGQLTKPAAIILIFFTFYHHLPQESLYRFLISSFSLNVSITFSLCYCLFFPYDSFLLQLSNESFICFLS